MSGRVAFTPQQLQAEAGYEIGRALAGTFFSDGTINKDEALALLEAFRQRFDPLVGRIDEPQNLLDIKPKQSDV